jgi:tricorn protease-like protein
MADTYTQRWREELETLALTRFETINTRKNKSYTNYSFPQVLENGEILVLKDGIGTVDELVLLKDGQEKRVFTPGIVNDGAMLSSANLKVVWNEYEYNPRWEVKTYSVIKAYDVHTNQLFRISSKSRYAGAALSPDGYQVATIETDTEYKTFIVILDFFSGRVLKRIENSSNDFYSMPRFSDDGKSLVVLKTTSTGKTISVVDIASGLEKDLLPISDENVGHPVLKDDLLFFNSPVSGIDNIYAYDINKNIRYQITSSKYGAFNPAFTKDASVMYYNEQSGNGIGCGEYTG